MSASTMRKTSRFLGGLTLAGLLAGAVYGQTAPKASTTPPATQAPTSPPATQTPATPPAAPAPAAANPDKIVMKVGEEKVTQADIDFIVATMNPQTRRALAAQGRKALGDQYATLLVLEQRALTEHLDTSPDFVRKLSLQRRQMLAEAAYNEIARQAAVTAEDANQYYTTHPEEFEQVKIRQVVIRKRPEGAAEGAKGLPLAEAQSRAEAIRKAMQAGTDPKKIVEQFQVPDQVIIDAEPRNVGQGSLRPDMQKATSQLKDGEVSEVFDLPQVLMFFQVVGRRRPELEEVTGQIESSLRQKKIEAALADLRKHANIWTDETYFTGPEPAPAASAAATTKPAAPAPPAAGSAKTPPAAPAPNKPK